MRTIYFIVGSSIGAPMRFLIDRYYRQKYSFPIGILLVNVLGSFILALVLDQPTSDGAFLGMGFCGAFTTWSALALDLDSELASGKKRMFYKNLVFNLLFGFVAAIVGAKIL
jgi:CrcB protein